MFIRVDARCGGESGVEVGEEEDVVLWIGTEERDICDAREMSYMSMFNPYQ